MIGRAGGHGHDRQRGVGAALGGQHAAVGDVEVGYREAAAVLVHDAVPFVAGHPGPADEVGVALDGDDLVGAGRVQDVLHDRLRGTGQGPVVVALGIGEAGHRQAVGVLLVGERHPVLRQRQELAQCAQARPVHVVAHVLAQRGAPVPLGGDVLGPGDRQRRDGLDREPALVVPGRVGLVELLGAHLGRRRLVHPHLGVEAARGLRRALDHEVAANLVEVVAQAVGEAAGRRVQQQPGRLDRVPGHGHHRGALEALPAVADVAHPGRAAGALVHGDLGDHGVGAYLRAVRQRVGDVRDQRRRLGVDLAALQAEAAVDAVRPVPEPAVGDRHRADLGGDPELVRAAQEYLAVPADRMRPVRVAVRVSPRPALAGHREFLLDLLVVRAQLGVAHRPVGAHAVDGVRGEVARVEARRVPGVVDHRAADAAPGVVRAHRHRVGPGDHPRVGPVQVVRACLVAHPVGVGVPERAGVQGRHPPPGPGQALQQDRAARAAADDHQVDLVLIGEPAHVQAQTMVGPGAVIGQQPGRLVTRPDTVSQAHQASFSDRVLGWVRVSHLERLQLADSGVLVAARIGRAGEADLGPGERMGVEGRAGVPGPQAPHVGGGQPVPVRGLQVLHRLDQRLSGRSARRPRTGCRSADRRPRRDAPACPATPGRPRACPRTASRRFLPPPAGSRPSPGPGRPARRPARPGR